MSTKNLDIEILCRAWGLLYLVGTLINYLFEGVIVFFGICDLFTVPIDNLSNSGDSLIGSSFAGAVKYLSVIR